MEKYADLTALTLVILVALSFGLLMTRLRQPAIVGYILAGVALGPTGFGLVEDTAIVRLLADLGVIMLLFVIGNLLLFNLFIAILLSNITSLPMEEESERRQSVGQAQFVHWFVYRRTVLWARRALQPDEMRPRSRSTRRPSACAMSA